MDQNTLTIVLFFFASALLLGVEAVKAQGRLRYTFAAGSGIFIFSGIFWTPLATTFPVFARQIASVAQTPISWFVLLVAIFLLSREGWGTSLKLGRAKDEITGDFDSEGWPGEAIQTLEAVWQSTDDIKKQALLTSDQLSRSQARFEELRVLFDDIRGDIVTANATAAEALEAAKATAKTADTVDGRLAGHLHIFAEQKSHMQALEKTVDVLLRSREAQKTRIALDSLEERIKNFDALLYFPEAEGIRDTKWDVWQQNEHQWRTAVKLWAFHASRYADGDDLMATILSTPQESFYGTWSFNDSDLPNADTIHRYKAFCIMRRNFADVKAKVDDAVWSASY
ncbi:hypothetical protein KOAAANKH_00993 [Brevundimonas sp. NIBR10]|uniref:hypothetical protein n=1 Tax=Brevundimonas sp. NIBR10 TaxID=3015997 RepID=UPI0022F1880A|nr:hypothetical protein [Brevundimonas sp. NIBR10]WGM46127.1 hypothetical protein KOAAANKH_00993 [Brevundimonas sp. NIBR10]